MKISWNTYIGFAYLHFYAISQYSMDSLFDYFFMILSMI